MKKFDDYIPIQRKAVYIWPDGVLGFAVSRKLLHSKWIYFIFTNTGEDTWYIASENELMFLDGENHDSEISVDNRE